MKTKSQWTGFPVCFQESFHFWEMLLHYFGGGVMLAITTHCPGAWLASVLLLEAGHPLWQDQTQGPSTWWAGPFALPIQNPRRVWLSRALLSWLWDAHLAHSRSRGSSGGSLSLFTFHFPSLQSCDGKMNNHFHCTHCVTQTKPPAWQTSDMQMIKAKHFLATVLPN